MPVGVTRTRTRRLTRALKAAGGAVALAALVAYAAGWFAGDEGDEDDRQARTVRMSAAASAVERAERVIGELFAGESDDRPLTPDEQARLATAATELRARADEQDRAMRATTEDAAARLDHLRRDAGDLWPTRIERDGGEPAAAAIDTVIENAIPFAALVLAVEALLDDSAGSPEFEMVAAVADALAFRHDAARREVLGKRQPRAAREYLATGDVSAALASFSFDTFPRALLLPDETPDSFEANVFLALRLEHVVAPVARATLAPTVEPLLEAGRYREALAALRPSDALRSAAPGVAEAELHAALEPLRQGVRARARAEYLSAVTLATRVLREIATLDVPSCRAAWRVAHDALAPVTAWELPNFTDRVRQQLADIRALLDERLAALGAPALDR